MKAVQVSNRDKHLLKVRELEEMVLSEKQPPSYAEVAKRFSALSATFEEIIAQGFPAYSVDYLSGKGIYSVVTKELIEAIEHELSLRNLLNARVLEIFAGHGLLSHFLGQKGIDIVATDDYSWEMQRLPTVQRVSYAEALKVYQPEVVFAFWPVNSPTIAKQVLNSASVTYYLSVDELLVSNQVRRSRPAGFSSIHLKAVEQALICQTDIFEPRKDGGILELKCSDAILYQRRSLTSIASSPKSW